MGASAQLPPDPLDMNLACRPRLKGYKALASIMQSRFKQDRLLMALFVYALYTLHNLYRHNPERKEFRKALERIVLDVPLAPKLGKFIREVLQPNKNIHT